LAVVAAEMKREKNRVAVEVVTCRKCEDEAAEKREERKQDEVVVVVAAVGLGLHFEEE
jgi:hypothetical protein